jgi:hypothetical protein
MAKDMREEAIVTFSLCMASRNNPRRVCCLHPAGAPHGERSSNPTNLPPARCDAVCSWPRGAGG